MSSLEYQRLYCHSGSLCVCVLKAKDACTGGEISHGECTAVFVFAKDKTVTSYPRRYPLQGPIFGTLDLLKSDLKNSKRFSACILETRYRSVERYSTSFRATIDSKRP